MINYKLEKNLVGGINWPRVSMVSVQGIPVEPRLISSNTEEENEKIIQSWKNVVVLRATSEKPTEFYLGFYNRDDVAYLKHEFKTNLDFALRIGSDDINFFVFPKDLTANIKLKIVEQTKEDDPKYPDLILI